MGDGDDNGGGPLRAASPTGLRAPPEKEWGPAGSNANDSANDIVFDIA